MTTQASSKSKSEDVLAPIAEPTWKKNKTTDDNDNLTSAVEQ